MRVVALVEACLCAMLTVFAAPTWSLRVSRVQSRPLLKRPPPPGGSTKKTGVTMMAKSSPATTAGEKMATAGMMSAASVAAAAVNAAVARSDLSAPEVSRSYVAMRANATRLDALSGLPLSYEKEAIERYWTRQGNALEQRWGDFLKCSVPFLLRIATLLVQGGSEALAANDASLARDARVICEQLGPTFIKLAQTLSVRPDVLPPAALAELAVLQDSVRPFDTAVALAQVEAELGAGAVDRLFAEISPEPVAAASLAQVYKATLRATNKTVAVKVQRPSVLETVSKDLYVLRRAVEVYQRLMDRFAPQQKTDYVALLNEWAIGFYTELDFLAEVENQKILRKVLVEDEETKVEGVYVPRVFDDLCTSRVAVTEWIDGRKLSDCDAETINGITAIAQEAFLVQLLEAGIFHADPHPGNLFLMDDGRLALLDFGLVARIHTEDQDQMVSAIIHLANKDFASLVDDFIGLEILPKATNRAVVQDLMDKALSPYIAGGGAKQYEMRVRDQYGMNKGAQAAVGGFQAMTQDALTVLNDVPFSIPPYFALLGRAIVTLEGIALLGDPDYALIQEAYPFVSRKLLSSDRPALRKALREALYGNRAKRAEAGKLDMRRFVSLVSSALDDRASLDAPKSSFIDFDSYASANATTMVRFVLDDGNGELRRLVTEELVVAADVLTRQATRRSFDRALSAARPALPLLGRLDFLPDPSLQRGPLLVPPQLLLAGPLAPTTRRPPALVLASPREVVDALAPPLSRDDELYAVDLVEVLKTSDLVDPALRDAVLAAILGTDLASPADALRALASTGTALGDALFPDRLLPRPILDALTMTRQPGTTDHQPIFTDDLDAHQRINLRAALDDLTDQLMVIARQRLDPLVTR